MADTRGEPAALRIRSAAPPPAPDDPGMRSQVAPDDLGMRALPALDHQAPPALEKLFRWVEADALDAYSWYLRAKEKKARTSKLLRIGAVVAIALGGTLPVLALILGPHLNAEWGFVVLAVGAAVLLLDRAFGFSRSWARYVATAMEIRAVLTQAQLSWAWRWVASPSPDGTDAKVVVAALADIETLARHISDLIHHETTEWVREVNESLAELGHTLDTRPTHY